MSLSLSKLVSKKPSKNNMDAEPIGHHSEHGHAEHHKSTPLPFIASPVNPEALKWVREKKASAKGGVGLSKSIAQFESDAHTESALANRIFRKQHEASSLELFFDLFFVANLAIFTARSAHTDWLSLWNYIGFFSILWSTWFHISMYDVRFYVDSVFTRFCKFVTFGIMVSFVGFSSLYMAILNKTESRAFQGLALVLFGSRLLLVVQYSTVMFFVREFDKTLVPMLLTMFVYVLSGIGFLSTWLSDLKVTKLGGDVGAKHVQIWYGVIAGETFAIIIIACIWRILSFKHTHLVERVGLLTLIILGEGIIGIVKSTSYVVQGSQIPLIQETGIIASAVLIIYLLYVLYFDNIDHHRFGTIGQQIWTLLHYPLHTSILLTVEGSTALILWNACRGAIVKITNSLPSLTDPKSKYAANDAFIQAINTTYYDAMKNYFYKDLNEYYPIVNFTADLSKLQKPKAAFGSDAWKAEVVPTIQKMSDYLQYFVYQNFGAEGPYAKLKKAKTYGEKVKLFEDGFNFVMCYFYIMAGVLAFVLAFLYWFGRQTKTRTEWVSIGIRIFGGICLPIGVISPLTEDNSKTGFRYKYPFLIIPVVALGYLLIIIVDNVVKAIGERHWAVVEERRMSRHASAPLAGDMELSHHDTSYDVHRTQSSRRTSNLHGIPEMVDNDDRALVGNAQKPGMKVGAVAGYSELEQEDDDIPGYRGQGGPHYQGDMRKH